MKEYDIFNKQDFEKFVQKTVNYFEMCEAKKLPFQKLRISIKKWSKSKSARQHRYFFYCANELRKAFYEQGSVYTVDQIKDFIKIANNYCDNIELPDKSIVIVPKSIANNSKDVDKNIMNKLIDWTINFTIQEFGYYIDDPRS